MSDIRDRTKPLPRSLRADTLVKTPLACRFGWHQMHWESGPCRDRYWKQGGVCARCNVRKERWV